MFQLAAAVEATIEVKHSKFIAYLVPYDLFLKKLEVLKEQHPKARHFVYAYRYLNVFDQIVENSSDDGEPKGTSGKPTLAVMAGHEMINTGVVIVRYFGGVKLGTGGLVRAYSDACNAVMDKATLVPYVKQFQLKFFVAYTHLGMIEYALAQEKLTSIEKTFEASGVRLLVQGAQESINHFTQTHQRLIEV